MSKSERRSQQDDAGEEAAPIDLSSLDPSRDEVRWAGMVKQVAKRASVLRAARRQPTVLSLTLSWGRPMLAAALVLVAATWAIAGARAHRGASAGLAMTASTSAPPALQVAAWANGDVAPETTVLLAAMGDEP